MNWPSQNDAQFGSLVKPGKLNPGGLSSRIPHWIYPLDFLMSLFYSVVLSAAKDLTLATQDAV
jgi:hypothetical protein